jgi:hypothetical protein
MVAGAHQTTCTHHPSQRALDVAEASSSAHPSAKHKAPSDTNPNLRVSHKVVIDMDEDGADEDGTDEDGTDEDSADVSDDGATTEPATEPADDDYKSIKAMVDADNQVCSPLLSLLNDILIYFSGFGLQTPGRADSQHMAHFSL